MLTKNPIIFYRNCIYMKSSQIKIFKIKSVILIEFWLYKPCHYNKHYNKQFSERQENQQTYLLLIVDFQILLIYHDYDMENTATLLKYMIAITFPLTRESKLLCFFCVFQSEIDKVLTSNVYQQDVILKTSQRIYFDNRRLSCSSCSLEKFYLTVICFKPNLGCILMKSY